MKKHGTSGPLALVLFAAVFLCGAGLPVSAQRLSLNIDEARTLALANSRSLAKYNLAIETGVLDQRGQFYTLLPSPSLGGSASATLWNAQEGSAEFKDTIGTGLSFGVSQQIFDGGKFFVNKTIAELGAEMSRQDALAEFYAVLNAADSAYYACLQAEASLESAESALETAELSLAIAETRSANGMIKPGDYLQALAEKESRENARNQAKRDLALADLRLKTLLGLEEAPLPQKVEFGGYTAFIEKLAAITEEETLRLYRELLGLAASSNPALAKASLRKLQAEGQTSLAARDFSPTLSASFSTGLNYSVQDGLRPSSGSVSLSGKIPLDYWVLKDNLTKKRIAREQAALDYGDAEESLETELYTALLDLVSQAGTVLSSRRSGEYADKHFEYVMELYRLNQNSVSDLQEASSLARTNQNQLIRSQYGFLTSLSKLRSILVMEDQAALQDLLLSQGVR
ncbi:MAG: TolC family protein [Treponema sp.]|jgi:outer membrane protein TolC|nr:TolC family protein [Treponema sp.]